MVPKKAYEQALISKKKDAFPAKDQTCNEYLCSMATASHSFHPWATGTQKHFQRLVSIFFSMSLWVFYMLYKLLYKVKNYVILFTISDDGETKSYTTPLLPRPS